MFQAGRNAQPDFKHVKRKVIQGHGQVKHSFQH